MFIFDEATSALDKYNEMEVQKAINGMKLKLGDVTQIVIAHRLSTIRHADNIIVLNKGQVIEQGSHDQLLNKYPNGVYSKLVADQEKIDNAGENKTVVKDKIEIEVDKVE
jgi:subfamily B ATP-binding cassette protein MsbA